MDGYSLAARFVYESSLFQKFTNLIVGFRNCCSGILKILEGENGVRRFPVSRQDTLERVAGLKQQHGFI